MKKLLGNKLLIFIFILGLFLRFYKLDKIPNGFYVDEAVVGYNAYSLLLTGADEYGKQLPVFLRSFGAYSSPLYSYVTTIFIKLFGLSIFSVRFLSAISGSLSVLGIYYLVKELIKDKKVALLASFVFAISPWSIFFSRGAYEANFALLILIIALIALVKEKYLIAAFFLALNTYAYPAQKINSFILIALFGLDYILKNKKNIKKALFNNNIISSLAIYILLLLPQILLASSKAFTFRSSGLFYSDAISQGAHSSNTLVLFLREFFAQYLNYFSLNNLFVVGDKDLQRSIPDLAPMYSILVIPYLIGLYNLFNNLKKREYQMLFFLFLLFPIVPALTKDPFSTLRNLSSIIPVTIIIALGITKIYSLISKKLFSIFAISLIIFAFLFLWRSYFVLFSYERAKVWSYGYEKLAEIVKESPDKKFVIENNRLKPAYILLAFYLKLDPRVLQKSVDQNIKTDYYNFVDWDPEYTLANFENRNINWEKDECENLILVGDELSISQKQADEHFLTKEFEIKTPNGEIVFVGYKTSPEKKCLDNI